MRNKLIIGLLAFPFLSLGAQNLDPTVEVTREYEGKLVEVHKPSLDMMVPDTLTRFALDFDYSVFENPYKGSYEFSPYTLSMRPSSSDPGERLLYVRAGVGYQLHPELDFVWSPRFKNRAINVDVYALHRSFIGNYWNMTLDEVSSGVDEVVKVPKGQDDRFWAGYDVQTRTGVDFRFDAERLALDLGVAYYGLARKNQRTLASLNSIDTRFGLSSKPEKRGDLVFDLDVAYQYAEDEQHVASRLKEHLFDFDVYFGPLLKSHHKLDFNVGIDFASYAGLMSDTVGEISVSPRYVFQGERASVCLGLLLAKIIGTDDLGLNFDIKDQIVYPNLSFSYILIPDAMKFQVTATGGNTINSYSSVLERNHHLTFSGVSSVVGHTMERVAVSAGFDGRITSRFRYNLKGGYVNYGCALLDAVLHDAEMRSYMTYAPYQKWYLSMDCTLKIENYRFDGRLSYDNAWGDVFETGAANSAVLRPASFTGEAAFEYNWNKRIFGGVDCNFMTSRKGVRETLLSGSATPQARTLVVPGFADLGIYGEYVTSFRLSAWLRVGNLLNMTLQRNPLYAEKGVNFTVGVCYSL